MKLFLLFNVSLILIFSSCTKQAKKESVKIESIKPPVNLDSLSDDLNKIIHDLEDDSQIGERFSRENYNKLFDTTIASEEELIALTNHKNPIARCTSFRALRFRNPDKVFSVLLNHLRDTTHVIERGSGCLSASYSENDYFIYISIFRLNDNDPGILTLRQKEIIDGILNRDTSIKSSFKGIDWVKLSKSK